MLTPRENLLQVFRHELPEWIPIVGHVDPYNQPNRSGMDPVLAEKLGTVQWQDQSTLIFSRYLGIDVMDYLGPPIRYIRRKVAVEYQQDGADTTVLWHTPKGALSEVIRRCREDGTSYRIRHLVNDPTDLELLAAIFEDERYEIDPTALENIRCRKHLIGQDGMLMLFMVGTPMGMMYRAYSGVATLAYLWADAPQALSDLFTLMSQRHVEQFRLAVQSDADALVGMDDTSTTAISPAMFEQYNIEYTNAIAAVVHEAGKLYFHHSCGLIRDLLPLYRSTTMDAVHAFTIPPLGNVTVGEGRRLLGDRITIIAGLTQLCGNLSDRKAVRRSISEMFEQARPGDHFILNIAGYPDKTMEDTRFVLDECRKHQRRIFGKGS